MGDGGWSSNGWPKRDSKYEVGFRRPPKRTRFAPGVSGNPKGRPRKRPTTAEILQEVLGESRMITENGVSKRMSAQKVVFKVLVANALKGEPRHSAQLFKLMSDYGLLGKDLETNELVVKFVGATKNDKANT